MAIPSLQVLVRTFGHYAAGLGVRGFEVLGKLGLYILAAILAGAGRRRLLRQGQPDLARQALDHLAEAEILALHDEVDGVAVRAATEAMEGAAPLVDGEGGRLLLVEGAQPLHHRARARQAHAPAHRLGQADPGLQFLDEGRRKGQDAPSPAVARCVSRAPASPARWRG